MAAPALYTVASWLRLRLQVLFKQVFSNWNFAISAFKRMYILWRNVRNICATELLDGSIEAEPGAVFTILHWKYCILWSVKLFHKIFHLLNTLPKYCTYHRIILASQKLYGIKLLLKRKNKREFKKKTSFSRNRKLRFGNIFTVVKDEYF